MRLRSTENKTLRKHVGETGQAKRLELPRLSHYSCATSIAMLLTCLFILVFVKQDVLLRHFLVYGIVANLTRPRSYKYARNGVIDVTSTYVRISHLNLPIGR